MKHLKSNLEKLSVEELVQLLSPSSDVVKELYKRNVLRTKNTVGELGEYFAIKFYNKIDKNKYEVSKKLPNLTLAGETTKNVYALSREGKIYSIKCISSAPSTTGSFWDPESIKSNKKTFDFLVIVVLDDTWNVDRMLELSWEDFFENKMFNKRMNNFNIRVTKKLMKKFTIISKK